MVKISACVLHTPRHHQNQEICAMKPPSMEFMPLVNELRGLIEQARQHVAQTANSTLTLLHWKLGARIQGEVLPGARASYGEEICRALSAKFDSEYGKGFSARNLSRMIQFAEGLPRRAGCRGAVATPELEPLRRDPAAQEPLEREFYAEMCRIERWRRARPARSASAAQLSCARRSASSPKHWSMLTCQAARGSPMSARAGVPRPLQCWTSSAWPTAVSRA